MLGFDKKKWVEKDNHVMIYSGLTVTGVTDSDIHTYHRDPNDNNQFIIGDRVAESALVGNNIWQEIVVRDATMKDSSGNKLETYTGALVQIGQYLLKADKLSVGG